jgi:hypothetical protein
VSIALEGCALNYAPDRFMAQWQRAGLIKMCLLKYITPDKATVLTAARLRKWQMQYRLISIVKTKSTVAK